ncbi:MAG: D-2-hydroxyacid dehydrogenase [Gemmatimonadaceae bacterium]
MQPNAIPLPYRPRKILIGYNVHDQLVSYLHERRDDLEYRSKLFTEITNADMAWADAFVGFRRPPVTDWGTLRWIHSMGAGVDAFLFRTDLPSSVLVTRTSEPFGPQIAEYCLTRALMFTQQVRALEQSQAARTWEPRFIGTLAGSRAVIVGTGEIGSEIAKRFRAMGCEVVGVSRSGRANGAFDATHRITQLISAVVGAQWLIVALPLTEDTFHLIDRPILNACRGTVLINVGRGAVVDEQAMIEALNEGWLGGAALDVFEVEPLPPESLLWTHERVIVSPHIAGLTTTAGAGDGFLECLAELENGRVPRWTVDRVRGY